MHLQVLIAALGLTVTTAIAGVTSIHNNCDFDVWITSVGATQGKTKKLAPGNYWNEKQYLEQSGVGTAIKITRTQNGLYEDKPVLHLSYSVDKGKSIYYDLSTHNGFDFSGEQLRVHGEEGKKVAQIVWDGAPKPNHTYEYNGDTDLMLELCE
ncbi:hypothetical protein ACN47E_003877 [Coniothyrium glycines]